MLWQQLLQCTMISVCVCVSECAAVSWLCRADRPSSHGTGPYCVLCCRIGSLYLWSLLWCFFLFFCKLDLNYGFFSFCFSLFFVCKQSTCPGAPPCLLVLCLSNLTFFLCSCLLLYLSSVSLDLSSFLIDSIWFINCRDLLFGFAGSLEFLNLVWAAHRYTCRMWSVCPTCFLQRHWETRKEKEGDVYLNFFL